MSVCGQQSIWSRIEKSIPKKTGTPLIGQNIRWWLHFESRTRDLSCLSQPRYGNQCGAIVNGNFITYESVLNDFYASLICNFLGNKSKPIIGEIGGGYGVLFYFISRTFKNFCYLDFDLPESLCCATYYLLKSFPEKKFLLYGEENILNEDVMKDYDCISFIQAQWIAYYIQ